VNYVVAQGYPITSVVGGAGNALKSGRQVNSPLGAPWATSEHPRWDSHSTHHGLDVFGFSALPGGLRYFTGHYGDVGIGGVWWSSTEFSTDYAWSQHLHYDAGGVGRHYYYGLHGFSVRCFRE